MPKNELTIASGKIATSTCHVHTLKTNPLVQLSEPFKVERLSVTLATVTLLTLGVGIAASCHYQRQYGR